MSINSQIAEQSINLCIGGAALLIDPTSGATPTMQALTSLFLLGKELRAKCNAATITYAKTSVIDALKTSGYSEDDLKEADLILNPKAASSTIDVKKFAEFAHQGDVAQLAAQEILAGLNIKDRRPGAIALVSLSLECGMNACLNISDLRTALTQEVILSSAKKIEELLSYAKRNEETLREHIGLLKELRSSDAQSHQSKISELQSEIDTLQSRLANPEAAFAEFKDTIAKLEDALAREGNDIGEARMTEAVAALEAGDFSIADDIFAEIEAREQLAVERTARAAFARGEIAEQEIRWTDAAKHYARAAQLNPTYDNLFSARKFAWRNGIFDKAIALGVELLEVAKNEFGEIHKNYAKALNEHALTLDEIGQHDQAEPLFLQAIDIAKQTIGEDHWNYATCLNNLAALYRRTEKYDQAESLFLQAIDIAKQTIGEDHPDYATCLNNLAGLYEITEKYDQAEPLYMQAKEITKHSLGEDHPDYATRLNNLAGFYVATGKYDQAEPLYMQAIKILETTLGPDHPNTIAGKANCETFLKIRP